MGCNNTGKSICQHCGATFSLFSIFNKDMQALCKIWRTRHERVCKDKSPRERRKWAKKYIGKDSVESSLTVDLAHPGFNE